MCVFYFLFNHSLNSNRSNALPCLQFVLRFKSEQAMLCSQGAGLATDCNQCEGAKAPWNLEGVKLTLNSKDNLRPQRGGDYPHLDYNKANAKSLFFLRFLCFFIYITHEKR